MVLSITPTVENFVQFFGQMEAIELSNLEDPSNGYVVEEKIQNAMDVAYEFVMSYDSLCALPGKVAIRKAIKRLVLDISRYFLDSLQRREDVTTNYNNCIEFLDKCVENKTGLIILSDEEAEQLGLFGEINKTIISYKSGRRAFTDKGLSKYRNQELYFN